MSSSSATSSRPTNCSTPAKMLPITDDDEPEPNTEADPSTPNSTQPSGATQALTDHEEL
ncbi:hypothetical protein H4Q26_005549, partial [Puccinia striiformis f. sp. tritici PST-130]